MSTERLRVVEDASTEAGAGELTIEQLAQETGMTVRNIRAHQSRGLLPPPAVRARTGYYGAEHVARLRLIQEMQSDGYNLNAIKNLLAGAEGGIEQLLGLKQILTEPFGGERPEMVTEEDLAERFGENGEKAIAKAEKMGALVPLGGDRYEVPSPTLLRAAEEVVSQGVPLDAALAVLESMHRH